MKSFKQYLKEDARSTATDNAKNGARATKMDWVVIETKTGSFYAAKKTTYDSSSDKTKSEYKSVTIVRPEYGALKNFVIHFTRPDGAEDEWHFKALDSNAAMAKWNNYQNSIKDPKNKWHFKHLVTEEKMEEDAPANNMGDGNVAQPILPMKLKGKQKNLLTRKNIMAAAAKASTTINEDTMITKAEANYRESSGPDYCKGCSMFTERDSYYGACTLVKGLIEPEHVCDHYDKAK